MEIGEDPGFRKQDEEVLPSLFQIIDQVNGFDSTEQDDKFSDQHPQTDSPFLSPTIRVSAQSYFISKEILNDTSAPDLMFNVQIRKLKQTLAMDWLTIPKLMTPPERNLLLSACRQPLLGIIRGRLREFSSMIMPNKFLMLMENFVPSQCLTVLCMLRLPVGKAVLSILRLPLGTPRWIA